METRIDSLIFNLLEIGGIEKAEDALRAARRVRVEVVVGDAALTDHYVGMVPAYLVLVCGVFGNMTDDDVRRTIGYCSQLCAHGGTVVWTRGRWEPDLVPQICDWFAGRGFELRWVSDPAQGWGAGAHRFTGTSTPHPPHAPHVPTERDAGPACSPSPVVTRVPVPSAIGL